MASLGLELKLQDDWVIKIYTERRDRHLNRNIACLLWHRSQWESQLMRTHDFRYFAGLIRDMIERDTYLLSEEGMQRLGGHLAPGSAHIMYFYE